MTQASREDIYHAMMGRLAGLINLTDMERAADPDHWTLPAGRDPTPDKPFRTITRKVIEVQRVEPGDQPVLMQYEFNEENVFSGRVLVGKKWTVVYIFGMVHDEETVGASLLNPLIDLVEPCFTSTDDEPITLDGMVDNVQLRGIAGKDHGDNSTKVATRNSSYYLPVEISLPACS